MLMKVNPAGNEVEILGKQYLEALLDGNSDLASHIIQEAFHGGIELESIYLKLISAAQISLGELWQEGRVSIAQEHIATEISMTQLAWLRTHAPRRAPLNLAAIVALPPEEKHLLPARIVADMLILDGWTVHFPGVSTPSDDLLAFIQSRKFNLVAFSLTMSPSRSFRELLKKIKKTASPPLLVVGGASAHVLSDCKEIDLCAPPSIAAIKYEKRFLGPDAVEAGLSQLKQELGSRIVTLRQERHLNQQQLSTLAQIDRAYLSVLENGKQNPSLHVLYRLATALGVTLQGLLGE